MLQHISSSHIIGRVPRGVISFHPHRYQMQSSAGPLHEGTEASHLMLGQVESSSTLATSSGDGPDSPLIHMSGPCKLQSIASPAVLIMLPIPQSQHKRPCRCVHQLFFGVSATQATPVQNYLATGARSLSNYLSENDSDTFRELGKVAGVL